MNPRAFKVWRRRLGYTQERAAKALGVTRRVVAGWETNETPIPHMVTLATWAIEQQMADSMRELDRPRALRISN
jgi:DNA-binding XRE family transcriptional regulator